MADKVKIDNFANVLLKEMEKYSQACAEEVKEVVKDVGKKARTELKRTSPKRSGEYAKKWSMKVAKENSTSVEVVVYDKRYSLVHLLEKGHQLRKGGRSIGEVKPMEHVAPAQEKLEIELEKGIKEVL